MHLKTLSAKWWPFCPGGDELHYSDDIIGVMVSQITSLTIIYSTIYSGTDQRKHQSSTSLAFVRGIHQWLMNSPHKWLVMWKMFPFDVVIMNLKIILVVVIHYDDVIMSAIASQITSLTIVYSIVYSDADQRKHQNSASLAFVWGIHRGPVNSPHKWPVTRKMFPFNDVIMCYLLSKVNRKASEHGVRQK